MKSTAPRKSSAKRTAAAESVITTVQGNAGMGSIQIHEDVIASLVRRATLSVEGVSRLAGSSLVDNIAEIVGSRRMQSRAISVELGGDNKVAVEIKLNVLFGYPLPPLAEKIQRAVIEAVEPVTGMTVTAVNVLIQEIEEPQEAADEESDEESDGEPLQ